MDGASRNRTLPRRAGPTLVSMDQQPDADVDITGALVGRLLREQHPDLDAALQRGPAAAAGR